MTTKVNLEDRRRVGTINEGAGIKKDRTDWGFAVTRVHQRRKEGK